MMPATRIKRRVLVLSVLLPLLAATATSAVATPTVVAQWSMDEPSGATTMTDASGLGNDGAITAVTTGVDPGASGLPGDFAYTFDGTTSHVTVKNANTSSLSGNLNPGPNDISISMQVNTTFRPGTGLIDYDMLAKGSAYKMEIYPAKVPAGTPPVANVKCKFAGSLGRVVLQGGADLIDGAWHTISCQKTSSGVTLVEDGLSFFKAGLVGNVRANTAPVAVGWQTNSTDFYHGMLDNVSITIG